jgi:CheY-like chemotaxis protein
MLLSRGRSLTVLIVEDHEPTLEMYSQYLRHLGMNVVTASDGAVGLLKAGQVMPDVIVMDIAMPVLWGDQVAEALKRDPRTREIPIVGLSAFGLGARVKARAARFRAFHVKPCLPSDLALTIAHVARLRRHGAANGTGAG